VTTPPSDAASAAEERGEAEPPARPPEAAAVPAPAAAHPHPGDGNGNLWKLSLAALGVVYGDIGTSPLYAVRECFAEHVGLPVVADNVLGVLSLMFWSLTLIVTVKYLAVVLRANNHGEGGILALMALALGTKGRMQWLAAMVVPLGIFGAALLYGDGVITPAISVLSAVEGIAVYEPGFVAWTVPVAMVILVLLFVLQRRGTAGVGAIFGPITLVWFFALAALGVRGLMHHPDVLKALNPVYAVRFFLDNGWTAFRSLGAVFLVVTGSEALYADMGHFGAKPIRRTWFALVLPALVVNYFGQGALLLEDAKAVTNPFYLLVPSWATLPMVVLATAAACIAAQAVISGAFSLTRQAIQLGFCPRMEIVHTSKEQIGQIYVPTVNWLLMAAVLGLVLSFRDSSGLAAAYGIAVSTTMVITAVLALLVAMRSWGWKPGYAVPVFGLFLVADGLFLSANATKFFQGGFLPLGLAGALFLMMMTWKRGRALLGQRLRAASLPLSALLESLGSGKVTRVPGTAVFMTGNSDGTPPALLHNLKHNKVVHERVVLLTLETGEMPHVSEDQRAEVQPLEHGFYRVIARIGFMETPDVPQLFDVLREQGLDLRMMETSFYLGRENLIPSHREGMARWRKALFGWMSNNARPAMAYFRLPPNRVVELGAQVEL